ncbi:hypothetical protein Tco_0660754 [Tanacetum coccineum]
MIWVCVENDLIMYGLVHCPVVMQSTLPTKGMRSIISTVSICLEDFLPFILLLMIIGWACAFHQDKASSVKVPVANVTLFSSAHLLCKNTDSVRSNSEIGLCSLRTIKAEAVVLPRLFEEEDGEWIRFLGGNSSSGIKKYRGLNSSDGGNIGDRVKVVGGVIGSGDEIGTDVPVEKDLLGTSLSKGLLLSWVIEEEVGDELKLRDDEESYGDELYKARIAYEVLAALLMPRLKKKESDHRGNFWLLRSEEDI